MAELTDAQKMFLDSIAEDKEIIRLEDEIGELVKPLLGKYIEMCEELMKHTTPELLAEHGTITIINPLLDGLMMAFRTAILDKIEPDWQVRAVMEMIGMLGMIEPDKVKKHLH